jgi:hypothetical protein
MSDVFDFDGCHDSAHGSFPFACIIPPVILAIKEISECRSRLGANRGAKGREGIAFGARCR